MSAEVYNPYMGLSPFSKEEFQLFFGRDSEIRQLLDCIDNNNFTAVIGFSGTGKSSLVKAGIIPSLDLGYIDGTINGWDKAEFTPRSEPLRFLCESLLKTSWGKELTKVFDEIKSTADFVNFLSKDKNNLTNLFYINPLKEETKLLIFADQFEELFTYEENLNENFKETQLFIDLLTNIKSHDVGVKILITMRAEYLQSLIIFDSLPETFSDSIYFVPRVSNVSLRAIIKNPASLLDVKIDSQLTELLIKSSLKVRELKKSKDDSLPMLQYLLMRLWSESNGDKVIKAKHYKLVGPLRKAIDNNLNEIFYFKQNSIQRKITKFLFASISDTQDKAKTKTFKAVIELYKSIHNNLELKVLKKEFYKVLNLFSNTNSRVLCFDALSNKEIELKTNIKVLHESVFRNWELCKIWLDKEADKVEKLKDLVRIGNKPLEDWKIKEFLKEEKYFTNELWITSKNFDFKDVKKCYERVERLHFKSAIMDGKLHIIRDVLRNNEKRKKEDQDVKSLRQILLTNAELEDGNFKKEFYYALYPDETPQPKANYHPKDENNSASYNVKSVSDSDNQKETLTEVSKSKEDSSENLDDKKESRTMMAETKEKIGYERLWDRWMYMTKEGLFNINTEEIKRKDEDEKYRIFDFVALSGNSKFLAFLNDKIGFNNDQLNSVFRYACYGGDKNTLNLALKFSEENDSLLEVLMYCSSKERNALHIASQLGNTNVVKKLLFLYERTEKKKDINISQKDYNKDTPLHLACINDDIETVKLLLPKFEIEQCNEWGRTPLHYACWFKCINIIEGLLKYADKSKKLNSLLNDKDYRGYTALMMVLERIPDGFNYENESKKLEIFQLLIERQNIININDKNKNGWTVLHLAVSLGKFNIIETLLHNKANIYSFNNDKKTPLHLAVEHKNSSILKLLLSFEENNDPDKPDKVENHIYELMLDAYTCGNFTNLEILKDKYKQFEFIPPLWYHYDDLEQASWKYTDKQVKNILNKTLLTKKDSTNIGIVSSFMYNKSVFVSKSKAVDILLTVFKKPSFVFLWDIEEILCLKSSKLPFYSNAVLFETIVKRNDDSLGCFNFVLNQQREVFWLNGKNDVIYDDMNKRLKLDLDSSENVIEYVKFFYSYVHGRHGEFTIVESIDQLQNSNFYCSVLYEDLTKSLIRPVSIKFLDYKNIWELESIIIFTNGLYYTKTLVHDSGKISITDEEILISGFGINSHIYKNNIKVINNLKPKQDLTINYEKESLKKVNELTFLKEFRKGLSNCFGFVLNKSKIRVQSSKQISILLEKTLEKEHTNEWSISLYPKERWHNFDKEAARTHILDLMDYRLPLHGITGFVALRSCDLSFYPGIKLYEAKLKKANGSFVYLTYMVKLNDKGLIILDGNSSQIHQMSKDLPINLNNDTIHDYFRFFNYQVHGGNGPFNIIESYEELEERKIFTDRREGLFRQIPRSIEVHYHESHKYGTKKGEVSIKESHWEVYAIVNYKNSLFYTKYVVIRSNGVMQMLDDVSLVEGFGILDNIYEGSQLWITQRKFKGVQFNWDKINRLDFLKGFRLNLEQGKEYLPFGYRVEETQVYELSEEDIFALIEGALQKKDAGPWLNSLYPKEMWHYLDKETAKAHILSLLNYRLPLSGIIGFEAVRYCNLIFYPDVKLFEVRLNKVGENIAYLTYMLRGKVLVILDGKSGPIYHMNMELPIVLNYDTIHDYFKFFNYQVHGKNGSFHITEAYEPLKDRAIYSEGHESLISLIPKPIKVCYHDSYKYDVQKELIPIDEPHWEVCAFVNYGDSLFYAKYIVITNTGELKMLEDISLIDGFSIDTFYYNNLLLEKNRIENNSDGLNIFPFPEFIRFNSLGLLDVLVSQNKDSKVINEKIRDIESLDYNKTALMIAIEQENYEIVAWLIQQKGIDLEIENEDGETALMLAQNLGNEKLVKLLISKGAKDSK